jgi:outer membrane translocation and assembly module TamA
VDDRDGIWKPEGLTLRSWRIAITLIFFPPVSYGSNVQWIEGSRNLSRKAVYNIHPSAHNATMRPMFLQSVCLPVVFFVGCHSTTQAQVADSSEMPVVMSGLQCPPRVVFREDQIASPKVVIADLTFEGGVRMAIADRDQIANSLKQSSYSGDLDGVASDLEERVRRAWREHGYFNVQVRGNTAILSSSPLENRIAVTFQVDEGQQYRLSGMTFKRNTAISEQSLHSLFAINDGDLFNVVQISNGLEKLSAAYGELGYLNATAIPATRINEENQTILLDVDIDEGKQFYVSNINILGLDEYGSQAVMNDFLLKPGDVCNQRLLDSATKRLSALQLGMRAELLRDERAGTVTISFRQCRSK